MLVFLPHRVSLALWGTYVMTMHAQIWIPDIAMYNGFAGLQSTLDPQYASVSSDGSVYYSRPGTYEVMCKFSGLVAFPFDTLSCGIEFGGWALSGGHQGILLDGTGYTFSKQGATSGSSYQEYEISALEENRTRIEHVCTYVPGVQQSDQCVGCMAGTVVATLEGRCARCVLGLP